LSTKDHLSPGHLFSPCLSLCVPDSTSLVCSLLFQNVLPYNNITVMPAEAMDIDQMETPL
jgi:hypothetical protein